MFRKKQRSRKPIAKGSLWKTREIGESSHERDVKNSNGKINKGYWRCSTTVQAVQVKMLAFESLDVKPKCYAPMLMPVWSRVTPAEHSVEFKLKELSRLRLQWEAEEGEQIE